MYEEWFQLVQRPFGAAPDSNLYFPSNGSEAARSAMARCVDRGAGPGIVIAPSGVGKTCLALKLVAHFRDQVPVAYVSGRGLTCHREILQAILFELGLPYGQHEDELQQQLIAAFSQGDLAHGDADHQRTLVIFDDADHLSPQLLSGLSALSYCGAAARGTCADFILLGTLKLENNLEEPVAREFSTSIAGRFYLHPFDLEETQAYLQFQLQQVAGCRTTIFSQAAVKCVLDCTGGVASAINQLCDHAMVQAMANGERRVDGDTILQAWQDLQQLPSQQRMEGPESNDEFIEFGTLEDPEPPGAAREGATPEEGAELADTSLFGDNGDNELQGVTSAAELFPGATLDNIERLVSAIVEVQDRPAPHRTDAAVDPTEWIACNPFLESFDEEEVVLDLPLGIQGAPRSAADKQEQVDELEEQQLMEELLTQMNDLELRSFQLEESLIATQSELARARAQAAGREDRNAAICEATLGGDVDMMSKPTEVATPYYAIEVVAGTESEHFDVPQPPADVAANDVFIQFVENAAEVELHVTSDVLPCEVITPAVDRAEVSQAEVKSAETLASSIPTLPSAGIPSSERPSAEHEQVLHVDPGEAEEINEKKIIADSVAERPSQAPDGEPNRPTVEESKLAEHPRKGTTPHESHAAETWPPVRKKRYRRLFSNLRNK